MNLLELIQGIDYLEIRGIKIPVKGITEIQIDGRDVTIYLGETMIMCYSQDIMIRQKIPTRNSERSEKECG